MFDFKEFWVAYPRKVGRKKAEKLWAKMSDIDKKCAIWGLSLWKKTAQWNTYDGTYVPYASTFLSQERWADEPWTGAFEEFKKPVI